MDAASRTARRDETLSVALSQAVEARKSQSCLYGSYRPCAQLVPSFGSSRSIGHRGETFYDVLHARDIAINLLSATAVRNRECATCSSSWRVMQIHISDPAVSALCPRVSAISKQAPADALLVVIAFLTSTPKFRRRFGHTFDKSVVRSQEPDRVWGPAVRAAGPDQMTRFQLKAVPVATTAILSK